jgi:ABC-type multidrug transport system fused ATPase/permease subunit
VKILSNVKIRQIIKLLSPRDRKKIIAITAFQTSLGILDLLGIAAMGVLGALTISGVSGTAPGNRVSQALSIIKLDNLPLQTQATWLGVGAGFILISKTVISAVISRKSLRFLGEKGAEISNSLISRLLRSDLSILNRRSNQDYLYATTVGPSAITLGVVGSASLLVSDISLTVLIFTGLFIVDWSLSLSTILLFGIVAAVVHKFLSNEARSLGSLIASLTVKSNQEIIDAFENFREIATRSQRERFANRIDATRKSMAKTSADLTFLPNVSKYIVELTIVFGGLFVGALQFVRQDAVHAVATLTLFVAASARIAPAVLRIQQGVVSIRVNLTACESALELDARLSELSSRARRSSTYKGNYPQLNVILNNVCFEYPDFKLREVSLEIKPRTFVALVGPSGSGKSTLADLLMGVLEPTSGQVLFNGESSSGVIDENPGIIGYVPQHVQVIKGSLRENVLFGFTSQEFSDEHVWNALEIASLSDTFRMLPEGLDTLLGDGANTLSGGQRQRLGIARSILTKPRLVVFDEATSALDAETEASVTNSLDKLKLNTSLVIIAHRLSTVRNADLVLYVEAGKIVASGSFDTVRNSLPNFDSQAKLMGL